MAAFRGQRFDVDLDSDEDRPQRAASPTPSTLLLGFVKDVKEKPGVGTTPPVAPTGAAPNTGFPAHRKRPHVSRFKQSRAVAQSSNDEQAKVTAVAPSDDPTRFEERERREIDKENRRRLAEMSDSTIQQEREELLNALPASLVQRLLSRATIDDPPAEFSYSPLSDAKTAPDIGSHDTDKKYVAIDAPASLSDRNENLLSTDRPPNNLAPERSDTTDTAPMHFPPPPQPPSLDPNSSTFLADLQQKYFPDLTVDPSKLAWMSEPSTAEQDSYSTSIDSLPVAALRFSFAGAVLPPSVSASIPTTAGLHHHGDAPAAAGYTIGELAHLARSSFPSQRCIAFQTLGRILYRLGRGDFGQGEEGEDVERGLWGCIREGRVLETLQEEAGRKSGHLSAKAYAVDALWLWQKGGGKEPREFSAG